MTKKGRGRYVKNALLKKCWLLWVMVAVIFLASACSGGSFGSKNENDQEGAGGEEKHDVGIIGQGMAYTEKHLNMATGEEAFTQSDNSRGQENNESVRRPEDSAQTESRASGSPMDLTDTWEEIIEAGTNGAYKEKYRIGDTKELDMGEEGIIPMRLVAMDEDELADGSGKAPMTWIADAALLSLHNMNDEDTNEGGWEKSGVRTWLRETVLPLMPAEVKNGIREVTKYSFSYDVIQGVPTKDTIWIPSSRELFGDADYEREGVAYAEVFASVYERIRRGNRGGRESWWLRSADAYDSDEFLYVTSNGEIDRGWANSSKGVIIGFCLGTPTDEVAITDSWEEIILASEDGTYKDRYHIGDTKELDVGKEGIITMRLVAKDEDELADGSGKASMTWVADELLQSGHEMNSEDLNEGDWTSSEMRSWLREEILPLMPEEVQRNIREVTKYSYSYEKGKDVVSTDTIWIPSAREVFLADNSKWVDEYAEREGVAYTVLLKDDASRVRRRADAPGHWWEGLSWWLRSAYDGCSGWFNRVGDDGGIDDGSDGFVEGVIVGFCL